MQVTVKVMGLKQAQRQLDDQAKKVDPVLRGALNSTATKGRTERFVKPIRPLFKTAGKGGRLGGSGLRGSLIIKRARKGRMNSRIIPSSSGVRIDDYRRWSYEVITPTRARIYVTGLRGRKVAAGFVNPASAGRRPWRTASVKRTVAGRVYGYKKALVAALGPSTAYWFKQLNTTQTIKWISDFLQEDFTKRMTKEIAKGPK